MGFTPRRFLDEAERDEVVRCQVRYFTEVSGGSEKKIQSIRKIESMLKGIRIAIAGF